MKKILQNFSFPSFTGLSLLLLVLMSSSAFADHFKGGYYTYNYLGEGRYEFIITGYWDKSKVGNVFPRYQGVSKIHGFPLTVSKTLMEDDKTVEHIQRQEVSWYKPGVYEVYWKVCCRATGSNFDGNPIGIFATVAHNPDAPSSSPRFDDDRGFNFNTKQKINYAIQSEDPDGHEQEFSLEVPYGLSADVYKEMLETGFEVKTDGTISWPNPIEGKWLISIRQREKIDGVHSGAYIDREYIFNVKAPGNKPDKGNNVDKKGGKAMARSNAFAEDLLLIPTATADVRIFPNPIKDAAQIKVVLEESDWIKFDVTDLSGRVIKSVFSGKLEAQQELSVEIRSSELGADKFYIGRLTTSNGVQSFKLIMQ